MALINCPECGKEISDKAVVCTNCGYPLPIKKDTFTKQAEVKDIQPKTVKEIEHEKKVITRWVYGIIIFIGLIIVVYIWHSMAEEAKLCLRWDCEEYHIEGGKACVEHTCREEGCKRQRGVGMYCFEHE